MTRTNTKAIVVCRAVAVVMLLAAAPAVRAQGMGEPAPPGAPTSPPPAMSGGAVSGPRVGGHIGVAVPLVTVASETTTVGDAFDLLVPIGVSVKLSDKL